MEPILLSWAIAGAVCVCLLILLKRYGVDKETYQEYVEENDASDQTFK